jgi:streptogramin lyase
MKRTRSKWLSATGLVISASCFAAGQSAFAELYTYTNNSDFDKGSSVNVVHGPPVPPPEDQLQLDDTMKPFGFIWTAVSSKGTVVKIDTETGQVLGEYNTAPDGMGKNPSRTTVDKNGNVWVANRDEAGTVPAGAASSGYPLTDSPMGSVVHIGLKENGECVDRNGNNVIDTSTGLGDVRGWAGGADTYGGVSAAEDECIIHYTRVHSTGTRHVSVNKDNNVWISGTGGQYFDLINGGTGEIMQAPQGPVGYGGYGGLIDKNGVIWSARPLLRWDPSLPLSGPNGGNWIGYGHDSYGLCIDPEGNVWNTSLDGSGLIRKFAPNGTLIGEYNQGYAYAQGCVVDKNGHVWVAHVLWGDKSVGHLLNDGTFIGNVTVPSGPTGVAVDANGKIWATCHDSQTASRIDPTLNGGVGGVDLTTVDLGGVLYNYSDMTGSTLIGAPDQGAWTVTHQSTTDECSTDGVSWKSVSWTSEEPGDSSITVSVANSLDEACTEFGPEVAVTNGDALSLPKSRCLKLNVSFTRSTQDEDGNGINDSPILYDISIKDDVMPIVPVTMTGIILIREGNDQAQFKISKVPGIKDAALAAVENDIPLTFEFGSCGDSPIYKTEIPSSELKVGKIDFLAHTEGNLYEVHCVFNSEQCVVNIKGDLNQYAQALDDLLTGNMTVRLGVGGTMYSQSNIK